MKKTLSNLAGLAFLSLILFSSFHSALAQTQTVSVIEILRFQDETGTNVSADVTRTLAGNLHQKLATRYKDLLPRLAIGSDGSTGSLTVAELAASARQNGAKYIVRAGLLALTCEPPDSGNRVTAQLYADIIATDSAVVTGSVRAEGSDTGAGGQQPEAAGVSGCGGTSPAAGRAFAAAIEQLADSIHQTVAGGAGNTSAAGNTTPAVTAGQADASQSAAQDADLQQLIAQTETLLSGSINPNDANVVAARQALQAIQSALEAKAARMQNGQDTSTADQEIVSQRQILQAAVTQMTTDAAAASSAGVVATSTPQMTEQKKGLLQSVSDLAGQSLSLLQTIQQMRTTVQSLNESSSGVSNSQPGGVSGTGSSPVTPQALGECSGVVTDQNGAGIPNAQVAEQTSGISALTDNNGQYDLKGLPGGQMATLQVTAGGRTLTAQTAIVSGQTATRDFQFTPLSSNGTHRVILPPTAFVNSPAGTKIGALKGVVTDPRGFPVAWALVTLKGLALARTDAQGRYLFLNVPAGPQTVLVNEGRFQPKATQIKVAAAMSAEASVRFTEMDRITPAGEPSPLVSTSGGITVTGLVADGENHALAGAKVSLIGQTSALAVFTGSTGMFTLSHLRPGQYRIAAAKAGYEPSSQNVVLGSSAPSSIQFRLSQQNSPVVANLLKARRAGPAADRTAAAPQRAAPAGSLAGQILDALTRRPVAGAIVLISGAQPTRTDEMGRFSFAGLPPGRYQLTIEKSAYSSLQALVSIQPGKAAYANWSLQRLSRRVP